MATQQQRRQATRTHLLATARQLLLEHGVAGTTTSKIIATAKISRGALYHHFAALEDLIAVVYEEEAKQAITRAAQHHTSSGSIMQDLMAISLAWLNEIIDDDVAKILIIEGPSALGWERCHAIESKYSLGQMREWLTIAAKNGEMQVESADLLARMINAILTEAALSIVHAEDKQRAYSVAKITFRQAIKGFAVGAN